MLDTYRSGHEGLKYEDDEVFFMPLANQLVFEDYLSGLTEKAEGSVRATFNMKCSPTCKRPRSSPSLDQDILPNGPTNVDQSCMISTGPRTT